MNLKELKDNQTAKVTAVGSDGALRQHFLDMGVIPGAYISFVKRAPYNEG
jgi:ferrous iron transport protein B